MLCCPGNPGGVADGERASVRDGSAILSAGRDGSIQLWEMRAKPYQPVQLAMRATPRSEYIADISKPTSAARAAHAAGEDISSLTWRRDGVTFASRSTDGCLKLWDTRRLDAPLAAWGDLPALLPMTGCDFSPDGSVEVDGASVVPLLWHPRLNQIVIGNADGKAYTLYDPTVSEKGALFCSVKAAPKRGMLSYSGEGFSKAMQIITPHALPMYREENDDHRKKRQKDRADPLKSRKPEQVLTGPGHNGKLSVGYQQALLATMSGGTSGLTGTKDKIAAFQNEDPREELLKYAKIAEEQPLYVTPAYSHNQPTGADPTAGTYPKFAKTVEAEEEGEDED
ncbi:hypothetical protein EMIHUDRAFT_453702 [Emiliania huxleyi CCMP1516]|uniref:Uncharacterized protein n=2 Tax=Emiliania huxleyi TaxID=2903 RepID=A0A0D3I1N5_EMIH1|nr:hypothetical protein EMIHUDRAFT_453702 [Emiliania huxleyi CCMP1516]EOD05170.1 hypothetical protein EMIHUDRAFT_453702 [Emiliania huxleyi CCMP1516]|eukprot:XP_005757599.1 hypothetical protein EMIHUDRAFT_453702 [Emiliania huxleyi CCMP1516]